MHIVYRHRFVPTIDAKLETIVYFHAIKTADNLLSKLSEY